MARRTPRTDPGATPTKTDEGRKKSSGASEAASTPLTIPARWEKLRSDVRATLAALPRAFALVWAASPGLTVTLAVLAAVGSGVPVLTAWLSKLLVDAVVSAARSPSHPIRAVVVLVVAQFALYMVSSVMQSARSLTEQTLRELTGNRVQLTLMEHANRLDLALFENPTFYDKLQRAQREAVSRPLGIVESVFDLVASCLTFFSLIALMARLGWLVGVIALVAPVPSFIASSRYGQQGYWLAWRQSADRCMMGWPR